MSLVSVLFHHQLAIKMFHFQTKKYGAHKAADSYLIKFEANLDRFMEIYQGENGRIQDSQISINFVVLTDSTIDNHLVTMATYLNSMDNLSSGLTNVRDDMLSDIQQFQYLLTFN